MHRNGSNATASRLSSWRPPTSRTRPEQIWKIVEPAEGGSRCSRWFDATITGLILLNVIAIVAESIPTVRSAAGAWFYRFETFSVIVFTAEYALRVYASVAAEQYGRNGPLMGRVRYAATPMAIIDLLAILPFYLPLLGIDLRVLRSLRIMRLARLARLLKLTRYSRAFQTMTAVVQRKTPQLLTSVSVLGVMLVVSASLMYYAERAAQPDAFSSIPATMWWSVATLTTVGYGDVYPITTVGKLLAAVSAVLGVGLFALPAGILADGFKDSLERNPAASNGKPDDPQDAPVRVGSSCPHCGHPVVVTLSRDGNG